MKTTTSAKWTLWIAAACVTAMTSTASAQADVVGPAKALSGGPVADAGSMADGGSLSGQGMTGAYPGVVGTCGTVMPRRTHWRNDARVSLVAVALHAALQLSPGQAALSMAAIQLWIASSQGGVKS